MSSTIRNHHQIIERLCNLVSEVGSVRYHDELPHDCFCGINPRGIKFDFQFDEEIIAFIESAVRERLSNTALGSIIASCLIPQSDRFASPSPAKT